MKKELTFSKVFWTWFWIDLAMMFINGATVKSSLLASAVHSTIGLFLLIHPVAPRQMVFWHGEEKSANIMRIIAAVQILLSFATVIRF